MIARGALILLGGGGHACVVTDAATASGWSVAGFLDDRSAADTTAARDLRHLGRIEDLVDAEGGEPIGVEFHVAIGDPTSRRHVLERARVLTGRGGTTIVHPSAIISPSAVVADAAFIGPLAVVNAGARIGRGAIVNSGAIVEHDCVVGAFSHVAPGAILAGSVRVGAAVLVGVGATVRPGITIGDEAVLGAGAVAVTDIPTRCRAFGVPARPRTTVAQGPG
ncbi:MAG: acetyltransferase [Planctomycetes bacterium]|nr:acetyltransferase [Planctomycetota bacterium]